MHTLLEANSSPLEGSEISASGLTILKEAQLLVGQRVSDMTQLLPQGAARAPVYCAEVCMQYACLS